ncbi:unnamed protein product [Darwinula stevensoni]|uniref:Condensin complex subunit 1 C-terminal domain-containing protein n=1 Tax=Darwinula stevensoni TaxID=69355 RepID=A0A7R9A449_9CRUS|nr:unnamed protein product [Darwinula stevensoni]CAG0891844.1 unnamed protein product [Darwinula stevensoni]
MAVNDLNIVIDRLQELCLRDLESDWVENVAQSWLALGADPQQRQCAFIAADFYFLLAAVTGSIAFNVFDLTLYNKTLETFTLITRVNAVDRSPRPPAKKRGRKKQTARLAEDDFEMGVADVELEDDEELGSQEPVMSRHEVISLMRETTSLLRDYLIFLDMFPVGTWENSIDLTVRRLVDLTRVEQMTSDLSQGRNNVCSSSAVAHHAYLALLRLCQENSTLASTICLCVMKNLMASILMNFPGASDYSSKALNVIRDHTLAFVAKVIEVLGEKSNESVQALMLQIAVRVQDKAESRMKGAQAVTRILNCVSPTVYAQMSERFSSMAEAVKVQHRLMAIEIISQLLHSVRDTQSMDTDEQCEPQSSDKQIPTQKTLLKNFLLLILAGCSDIGASVRAKALAILADVMTSQNPLIRSVIKSVFLPKETESLEDNRRQTVGPSLPSGPQVLHMLHMRSDDEKVFVRKSSLQVLQSLLVLSNVFVKDEVLTVLQYHCRDSTPLVRKQMIQCLSDILNEYPENLLVVKHWVLGILPMSMDPEAKVQEKVLEAMDAVILKNLVAIDKMRSSHHQLPWVILNEIRRRHFQKYFKQVCEGWAKAKMLTNANFTPVLSHVKTVHQESAWMLIAAFSDHLTHLPTSFILRNFYAFLGVQGAGDIDRNMSLGCGQCIFWSLKNCVPSLNEKEREELKEEFLRSLGDFKIHASLICTAASVLDAILDASLKQDGGTDGSLVPERISVYQPIIFKCEAALNTSVLVTEGGLKGNIDLMKKQLITLGHLVWYCIQLFNMKIALIFETLGFQLHQSGGGGISSDKHKSLQAIALSLLGKLSLQHYDVAKKVIPAFGKLLASDPDPAVRINATIIISDLYQRYGTELDPILPRVFTCLKDDSAAVRKNCLVVLLQLLQEDYLKIKAKYLYVLLTCLLDESSEIRHLIRFFLEHRMKRKKETIFYQHFVESLFYYNKYEGNKKYNKFKQNKEEQQFFTLPGSQNRKKRRHLYSFMLQRLNDQQRLQTTCSLSKDVLDGFATGDIPIEGEAEKAILSDALWILTSEDIKLSMLRGKPEEEPVDGDNVVDYVKRNAIENIIPVVVKLKRKLEERKSPVLYELMVFLRELTKEYKNEVKDILSTDPQLAEEIQYDLKELEKKEKARQEREDNASEQGSIASDDAASLHDIEDRVQCPRLSGIMHIREHLSPDSSRRWSLQRFAVENSLRQFTKDQDAGINKLLVNVPSETTSQAEQPEHDHRSHEENSSLPDTPESTGSELPLREVRVVLTRVNVPGDQPDPRVSGNQLDHPGSPDLDPLPQDLPKTAQAEVVVDEEMDIPLEPMPEPVSHGVIETESESSEVEEEYLGCEIETAQPATDGINSGMGIADCGANTAFGNVMNPYILIERLALPLEVSKTNVQSQSEDLNPSAMPAGIPCQEFQSKLQRISADLEDEAVLGHEVGGIRSATAGVNTKRENTNHDANIAEVRNPCVILDRVNSQVEMDETDQTAAVENEEFLGCEIEDVRSASDGMNSRRGNIDPETQVGARDSRSPYVLLERINPQVERDGTAEISIQSPSGFMSETPSVRQTRRQATSTPATRRSLRKNDSFRHLMSPIYSEEDETK